MAYISYNKLREREVDIFVSKKVKMRDINLDHFKLQVHDTFRNDEKITTNSETSDDTDVINKAYVDKKLSKIEAHLSLVESYFNENLLHSDKQSIEEILVQRAVKTTKQILYDKGLFNIYDKADEVLKKFLVTKSDLI